MRYLYLNHFRGFSNSFIPITDVNFLVGENSTGKSSLLSLLKVVSNINFWRTFSFNTDEVELGYFQELVSNNIKGKKFFEIGFYDSDAVDAVYQFVLTRYTDVNGEPALTQIRYMIGEHSIQVNVQGNQLQVRIKQVKAVVKGNLSAFKRWIKDENFSECQDLFAKNTDEFMEGNKLDFFSLSSLLRKNLPKLKIRSSYYLRPVLIPFNLIWVAPIRTKPKRIYEGFQLAYSPEGNHTPLLIKDILTSKGSQVRNRHKFISGVEKFGRVSGLFDRISVEHFGAETSSPFTINIHLNKSILKLTNVGYGIAQILPVLTEILISGNGRWFAIQQPEVHLHPKAQAAFGDFIYSTTSASNHRFLIETHSDFIVDRFRLCLKNGRKKVNSQVLFFEHKRGQNFVRSIPISEDGQYSEKQPKAFRDFFLKEQFNLLKI